MNSDCCSCDENNHEKFRSFIMQRWSVRCCPLHCFRRHTFTTLNQSGCACILRPSHASFEHRADAISCLTHALALSSRIGIRANLIVLCNCSSITENVTSRCRNSGTTECIEQLNSFREADSHSAIYVEGSEFAAVSSARLRCGRRGQQSRKEQRE